MPKRKRGKRGGCSRKKPINTHNIGAVGESVLRSLLSAVCTMHNDSRRTPNDALLESCGITTRPTSTILEHEMTSVLNPDFPATNGPALYREATPKRRKEAQCCTATLTHSQKAHSSATLSGVEEAPSSLGAIMEGMMAPTLRESSPNPQGLIAPHVNPIPKEAVLFSTNAVNPRRTDADANVFLRHLIHLEQRIVVTLMPVLLPKSRSVRAF